MPELIVGPGRVYFDREELVIESSTNDNRLVVDQDLLPALIEFLCSSVIDTSNRRRAFRVEIEDDFGLNCQIEFDGRTVFARPLDLSLTGVLVELTEGVELPLDTCVHVNLIWSEIDTVLKGIVRRKDGNKHGIFFPESIVDEELDPSDDLRSIVAELERRWLIKRVNS